MKQKVGEPACPVSQLMMGAYQIFKDDLKIKSIRFDGIQKPASTKPGACDQAFIVETRE